jgi:hypothetical protein
MCIPVRNRYVRWELVLDTRSKPDDGGDGLTQPRVQSEMDSETEPKPNDGIYGFF